MTTRSDGAAVLAEYDAESEQLRERLMTMRRRMHAMESRHQLRQRAASSPANEPPIRLAAPSRADGPSRADETSRADRYRIDAESELDRERLTNLRNALESRDLTTLRHALEACKQPRQQVAPSPAAEPPSRADETSRVDETSRAETSGRKEPTSRWKDE